MLVLRVLKWLLVVTLVVVAAGIAFIGFYGWNWLREPVTRLATEKTGRELTISGDLGIRLAWPRLLIRAGDVRFANPPWAAREHMLTAASVDFSVNIPPLLARQLVFNIVTLRHADVHLEIGSEGRKNWLLDLEQKDESTRPRIARLALEQSRIAFDDAAGKTHVVAELSTRSAPADGDPAGAADVTVSAEGKYHGLPLVAKGSGGPLLALRDEGRPYPFSVSGTIGRTRVKAEGTVTDLSELEALDAEISLRGANLADLFPVIGIVLPKTPPYRTSGRITHSAGVWRYSDFYAHVGESDVSGTLQVDADGQKRPFLHGELTIGKLDFADLGPVIGSRKGAPADKATKAEDEAPSGTATAAKVERPRADAGTAEDAERVLPDIAFQAQHWDTVDADVNITARTIVREKAMPIDRLSTRLQLRDSSLTLDPLEFGIAGGTLAGAITLDGRRPPIRAKTRLEAKNIVLGKLLPALGSSRADLGLVTGKVDLAGTGNSVATMLGSADGTIGLVVNGGEMSRLMMETAGLHVLEIIALRIAGDRPIAIHCGMASLQAREGVMQVEQMVVDTEISNITGSGVADFEREQLNLTLTPRSKETNLISLRTPIFVRGSFAKPQVDVDKARLVMRGLGALALGVANPLLALAPLVEAGPGLDSDCGRLLEEARKTARPQKEPEGKVAR